MRLTKLQLDAAIEALSERLGGEIETDIPLTCYRAALSKLQDELARRMKTKRRLKQNRNAISQTLPNN